MRTALTLAILLTLGATAHADNVGVIVDGEGSIQPQLAAQIAAWLARHKHTVVASPLPPETVPLFTDAMKTANLSSGREIIEKHATSAIMIYARVDITHKATSGARDLTVTVYWLAKGRDATSQKQDCARCTDQLLRAAIDDTMKKLLGGGAVGHVKLKSSPPGARIVIDGQPIGVTPLDWDLPTGKHSIQMDKAGLKPASRDVMIASDKLELVVETLDPIEGSEPAGQPSHVVPGLVLVAGGALIATGAVLIAIDQDAVANEPAQIYDTAKLGVGLAVGGAVVGGLGAYLWFRSSTHSSAPVAAFTRDTAYIGWAGRF